MASRNDPDHASERTARLVSHLEGVLQEETLHALQGTWSVLEHAAADSAAHSRAVRARLFWESLSQSGYAASPGASLVDLAAARELDEDMYDAA